MQNSNPSEKIMLEKQNSIESAAIKTYLYQANFYHELERYGRERLRRIYYDMLIIREFEKMLRSFHAKGTYGGMQLRLSSPAINASESETVAVGLCLELERTDLIFGEQRGHAELIAKCFSGIRTLHEEELFNLLKKYRKGALFKVIEDSRITQNIYEMAEYLVLYGLLAEILGCRTGFNAGLCASANAFFEPLGVMPNNAIRGGSTAMAFGSALFKKCNDAHGIAIASLNEDALANGVTWETLIFASMDQYQRIWEKEGAPPFLINVYNRRARAEEISANTVLGTRIMARLAAGINQQSMHAERVDGENPLAVADAIRRKKKVLYEGRGPVLLENVIRRTREASFLEPESKEAKEEFAEEKNQSRDPVKKYEDYLIAHNIMNSEIRDSFCDDARTKILTALKLAQQEELSPRTTTDIVRTTMFSSSRSDSSVLLQGEESSRIQELSGKKRYARDEQGRLHPARELYTFRDAVFEAVLNAASADSSLILYGDSSRESPDMNDCYRGLAEFLPHHRYFSAPATAPAIIGAAVGYALSGGRVLLTLSRCDFLGRAGDEIFNQMAKWQGLSAGVLQMPLLLRVTVGGGDSAQLSQDWTSFAAQVPGLQAMYPVSPYDAKGMLSQALSSSNPALFFESHKLYDIGELFYQNGVPKPHYEIEPGIPVRRRSGSDLSIFTLGPSLYPALAAARFLSETQNVQTDLIDLRFINPLNYSLLLESIKKTGKLLLVSDAAERASFMHTVASNITAAAFNYLDAPPQVLGSQNWPKPPAKLERAFFPTERSIVDAIDQNLIKLKGYQPRSIQSIAEKIRAQGLGI